MNEKLQQAIQAIKSGDRKTGQSLLVGVIKANPKSKDAERAWLWMSAAVDDPERKRQCLETVLALNPNNELAKKGLKQLVDDLPKIEDIVSTQAKISKAPTFTKPAKKTEKTKQRSGCQRIWYFLIVTMACMLISPFVFLVGSDGESSSSSTSPDYSVTFRVYGNDNSAKIMYGYGDTENNIDIQLPWEYTVGLNYGDTAALVATSRKTVKCEIWIDGELRTSSQSGPENDNMAVCGYVVGRNITINVVK